MGIANSRSLISIKLSTLPVWKSLQASLLRFPTKRYRSQVPYLLRKQKASESSKSLNFLSCIQTSPINNLHPQTSPRPFIQSQRQCSHLLRGLASWIILSHFSTVLFFLKPFFNLHFFLTAVPLRQNSWKSNLPCPHFHSLGPLPSKSRWHCSCQDPQQPPTPGTQPSGSSSTGKRC